ncbi:MAG: methyltransferase [Acidobacteriia bacterium]|nr:methyltransferase [Terriglobia bacterium]
MSELVPKATRVSTAMQIMKLIQPGISVAQPIYVVAMLGIADLIGEGRRDINELALMTKTHAPTLHRVLRALTSLGVFVEDPHGIFQNTASSETLRRDHPESVRVSILMLSLSWKAFGELYNSVRSGRPAFELAYGQPFFEYLAEHPEDAAIFNEGMTAKTVVVARVVTAAYEFSKFERIIDVGGGQGAFLHRVLSANPKLRGVLYDLPAVVASASVLLSSEVTERCEIVGENFLDSVPQGADAYVLINVIHNWQDEEALTILRNCHRAMSPHGTLLLVEAIQNSKATANLMDLNMLLLGGMERNESQFRSLLAQAGFSVKRIFRPTDLS